MRKAIGWYLLAVLIVWLDAIVWRRAGALNYLMNPTLLLLVVYGAWRGWVMGLWVAVLASWYFSSLSVFPIGIHLWAWLGTTFGLWFSSKRFFATRSTTSFLALNILSAVLFPGFFSAGIILAQLVAPEFPEPIWVQWWTPQFVHIVTHVFIGWVLWRLAGRKRSFTTAGTQLEQSF